MTTLQQAISFNVEASLNEWMRAALAAFLLPAWMTSLPPIVYDYPELSASIPCFSFVHLPIAVDTTLEGKAVGGGDKGGRVTAMLEISCWVSRAKAFSSWYPLLLTMRDMVISTANASSAIVIYDYMANLNTPAATMYKVNIENVTLTPVQDDPNPDVERIRILIDYSYVYRSR